MDKASEPGNPKKPADMAKSSVVFVSRDPKQDSPKKPSVIVNWKELISPQVLLMLGQLITGITILVSVQFWNHDSTQWKALIFVTYNATAVTMMRLIDTIAKGQPVRSFFALAGGDRLELWFAGSVAFLLHLFSFFVSGGNLVGIICGYVTAALYFIDWCRMHRARNGPAGSRADPVVMGST